ncbi:uncharacterized protein CYBJADRAFT_79593 [Cyberlindnera jadinii NRRL Y-1542]|uniref:Uncharacterized protein n=1 Tax=Cyberlindnera jadinii (strain ATCC 18201 / CBS 1600 / BCRC 20928 / JCM 3617 / NBRC 0987 / NRRL Y-1542) TaxID=983966 RepID=A0A1E4S314_CYBJN|nr:hypothetical protein CYBJADRAFT_79593 [Cyberlindnera jadinii NRRL Y-1542]ODV73843.1 hypothetical protein CYBJADRAFT_79593 [Cyberlindnera jadinii NRRL Y-1542]
MSIIELSKRQYVCDASGYCYYRRNSTYWWIVFVVVIPILVFAMVLMLLRRRNLRRSRQGQSYIPYTGWTTYGNNNQAQTSQRTTTHSNKVTTTTQIPNQQRKQRNSYRLINRTRHPPPRQRRMSIQRIVGQQVRHRHTIKSQVQTRYSLHRTLTRERNGHHRLRGSTHFLIALNKTQIIMIMSFYILQQQQNSVEITYRIQPHDTYKDRES